MFKYFRIVICIAMFKHKTKQTFLHVVSPANSMLCNVHSLTLKEVSQLQPICTSQRLVHTEVLY